MFWTLLLLWIYSKLFIWLFGHVQELVENNKRNELNNQIQQTSVRLLQSLSCYDTVAMNKLLIYDYIKKEKARGMLRDCRNYNFIIEKYPIKDSIYNDLSLGPFKKINLWYYLVAQPDSALNIKNAWIRIDFYPYFFLENNTDQILDYKLSIEPLIDYFSLTPAQRDSLPFNIQDFQ